MLDELLKDLGGRLGLGALAPDADGTCTLAFGDGAEIHVCADGDPNYCVLVGDCGGVPDDGRAAYLQRLLEANFQHRDTGGAVLAYEPEIDEVLLIQRVRLDMVDGAGFEQAIAGFAAYQERWSTRSREALAGKL